MYVGPTGPQRSVAWSDWKATYTDGDMNVNPASFTRVDTGGDGAGVGQ